MPNRKKKSLMTIIAVILMLAAILGYVLSLDESDPSVGVEEIEGL